MATGILDPEFLIGASLAENRFKIVARVGEGSMAVVYRAFDHRLQTEVVVKVPKKQKLLDPELMDRFHRESNLLVQLQHPHIVRILDVGRHSNVPFVVMQYLSGGCLLDHLQGRDGRKLSALPASSIRGWLMEVAKALDFAHQRQVVHRDVKPANILFDDAGNAFLSDFGLTKMLYGEHGEHAMDETAAGYVVGTPNFVAPEIVLGQQCDGRSDQYSLGISLYTVLTGAPPMLGKSPSATMVNQTQRILPVLSDVRQEVPVATALAIARAIQKKPAQRFATCVEFAEAAISGLTGSSVRRRTAPATANSTIRSGADSTTVRRRSQKPAVNPPADARFAASSRSAPSRTFSRAKSKGVICCPHCRKEFRLRPEHAGRRGRCVQCGTRLKIGSDLMTLKVVTDLDASSNSGSRSDSSSSDDLIIGEKVFGKRMSRSAIIALAVVMLLALVAATAFFAVRASRPDENSEKIRDYRSMESLSESP